MLRFNRAAIAMIAGTLMTCGAALAAPPADSFNRPTLTNWVATNGTLAITDDQLTGTTLALGYLTGAANNDAASVVVFLGGTDLEYGAVAIGNIAGANNAFVKIQSQDGGNTFDHGAFYTGNNSAGDFFALSSPVSSPAVLDVAFCNSTAVMRITSASGVQTYSYNYHTTFGNGAGLGTYGAVALDNFISYRGACGSLRDAVAVEALPKAVDWSLPH